MADGFIINVCLTGMVPTREMSPHVPMTPREIARDVKACVELGASIVHVHARDDNGAPDWRSERYQAILEAIREQTPDVIISVSTSGRRIGDLDKRLACLACNPKPDMASLTMGSINFLRDSTLNSLPTIRALAEVMNDRGIKPEIEVFDLGMARATTRLADEGLLRPPFCVNLLLGNVASAGATPLDLGVLQSHLPGSVFWCGAGIGRDQLRANALGILFGNGVRVGLEDNLYLDECKTLATNQALVERVVRLGRLLGKEPMSIAETRERLACPRHPTT